MKKLLSSILLTILIIPTTAFADAPISLGTSAISTPVPALSRETSTWSEGQGNYVYFGSYPQSVTGTILPIKWKVLRNNETLFLYSDKVLDWHVFDVENNTWAGSDIQAWLNNEFLDTAFTTNEANAIVETYKDSGETVTSMEAPALTGEKTFLLSWEELDTSMYGFYSDNSMLYSNKTKLVPATDYAAAIHPFDEDSREYQNYFSSNGVMAWTRSPSGSGVTDIGGGDFGGWFGRNNPNNVYGIAPGINVDIDKIGFTIKTGFERPDELIMLEEMEDTDSCSLAIITGDGFYAEIVGNGIYKVGETAVANTAALTQYDQISAMVLACDTVIAYGKVGDMSGKAEFRIPDSMKPGVYTLRLFAETINSSTDYISNFIDSKITVYKEKLILPDDLKIIDNEAFMGCTVQYVVVPAEVQRIGQSAFADCENLTTIEFNNSSVIIDQNAFADRNDITILAPSGGSVEMFAAMRGLHFVEN